LRKEMAEMRMAQNEIVDNHKRIEKSLLERYKALMEAIRERQQQSKSWWRIW